MDKWVRSAEHYVTNKETCECDCVLCNPLNDFDHCDGCNDEFEVVDGVSFSRKERRG